MSVYALDAQSNLSVSDCSGGPICDTPSRTYLHFLGHIENTLKFKFSFIRLGNETIAVTMACCGFLARHWSNKLGRSIGK